MVEDPLEVEDSIVERIGESKEIGPRLEKLFCLFLLTS